jgi:type IV fimbrial biogenesis protein FimT
MNRFQNTHRGFTLVELIVTLAITVILLTLGIPAFRDMTLNNSRTGRINELVTALQLARSESVKRGVEVSIANTGAWEQGWTVFVDDNSNGTLDGGEQALRVTQRNNPDYTIRPNGYPQFLTYDASGAINIAGDFTYCDSRSAADTTTARAVIINNTGRPRMSIDSNGDGIHEDGSGANLTCP